MQVTNYQSNISKTNLKMNNTPHFSALSGPRVSEQVKVAPQIINTLVREGGIVPQRYIDALTSIKKSARGYKVGISAFISSNQMITPSDYLLSRAQLVQNKLSFSSIPNVKLTIEENSLSAKFRQLISKLKGTNAEPKKGEMVFADSGSNETFARFQGIKKSDIKALIK